jgi:hypothetical protein
VPSVSRVGKGPKPHKKTEGRAFGFSEQHQYEKSLNGTCLNLFLLAKNWFFLIDTSAIFWQIALLFTAQIPSSHSKITASRRIVAPSQNKKFKQVRSNRQRKAELFASYLLRLLVFIPVPKPLCGGFR